MSGRPNIDVMISSTSKDLAEHRQQASDAVRRSGLRTQEMEQLTATLGNAISVSLRFVNQSEIYIGIIGMRYGYVPDDPMQNPNKLSITELEYRRALERNIPILIYMMDKKHPALPRNAGDEEDSFFEADPDNVKKLKALKAEMEKRHIVGYFKSPMELRALVVQSLADPTVIEAAEAKAGELDKPESPDTTGIPTPPELYAVPKYTLTNTFIGRGRELRQMDEWAASPTPMLVFEAIGGMGKSALTWEWVGQKIAKGHDYRGIVWYSFYEGGAQMRDCIRHILAYITHQNPDDLKPLSQEEMAIRLLTELDKGRWLLVLDGLERILVAYHRVDAAQVRDDQVARDMRDCISPRDNLFLQKLAGAKQSKILLSSRLMPRALETAGDPIPGVKRIRLGGLDPKDGLTLMRDRGVTWDDEWAVKSFMSQIGYHGLLLKIAAGRIKTHRRARRHFETWYELDGRFLGLNQLMADERRTHVLAYAFDGLDADKKQILSQIAAFSDLVDYDTLSVFNLYIRRPPEDIDEQARAAYEVYLKSEEYRASLAKFDAALAELEDRGLLQWERETDNYELHPVVRGYSFDQLADKSGTFNRIHDHFQKRPQDYDSVQSLGDLRIGLEIYRALLGAGRLDDAASFYRGTFAQTLLYNLTAYPKMVELLRPLFPGGQLDAMPQFRDKDDAGYVLNDLSLAFGHMGRSDEALAQLAQSIALELDNKRNSKHTIIYLTNFAERLRDANRPVGALRGNQLAQALAEMGEHETEAANGYVTLMRVYVTVGDWAAAEASEAAYDAKKASYIDSVIKRERVRLKFYRGEDVGSTLVEGLQSAIKERAPREQMLLYGLQAQLELADGALIAAEDALDAALSIARRSGHFKQAEFMGLLGEIQVAQGRLEESKAAIQDALALPTVELDKAAIFNSAAIVYDAAGDFDQAREYVLKAYEVAWADGEPFSNWYELKRARVTLAKLGVDEPKLPSFDPDKVGKMPREDDIRALIAELGAKKAEREAVKAKKGTEEENIEEFLFDDDDDE